VGGDDQIRRGPQRIATVAAPWRSRRDRARQVTVLECIDQCCLVDNAAARHREQIRAALQLSDLLLTIMPLLRGENGAEITSTSTAWHSRSGG